jgi:hypothetical protein
MFVIANEQNLVTAKNDTSCTIAYDHINLFKKSNIKLPMVLRLFYYTICQPDSENDAQNTGKPVSA